MPAAIALSEEIFRPSLFPRSLICGDTNKAAIYPYITVGIPASISTIDLKISEYFSLRYSDMKIDDKTPIGVAITTAIVVINNVPVSKGMIPRFLAYSTVFCGFQSIPNKKFFIGTKLKNFNVSVSNNIIINIMIEQVMIVRSSNKCFIDFSNSILVCK